jgi:hypothetical protein
MLRRFSCWTLATAWAALAGGCASVAPNSGLPTPRWLVVEGPISDDTRVLPLRMDEPGFWRTLRPSRSEQGLSQSEWSALYLALVPANHAEVRSADGALSGAVTAALAECGPDLGSFADDAEWWKKTQHSKTGKVRIAGVAYFQYIVHSLTWSVTVSDTGRGYRLSRAAIQSFGSFSSIPRSATSRQTARVAYGAPERPVDRTSAVVIERADTAAVKASCVGGSLTIVGTTGISSAGPWFNGILNQPFNVYLELQEEVLP